jgi:hypothetical protein
MTRPHEPGVDPPTTPKEEQAWMRWARSLTDIQLRVQYRKYWEQGERAGMICSILQYAAVERAATNDDLQHHLHHHARRGG